MADRAQGQCGSVHKCICIDEFVLPFSPQNRKILFFGKIFLSINQVFQTIQGLHLQHLVGLSLLLLRVHVHLATSK